MFCRSLFVLLSFVFCSLCCLTFFDIRLLIISLVSSSLSYGGALKLMWLRFQTMAKCTRYNYVGYLQWDMVSLIYSNVIHIFIWIFLILNKQNCFCVWRHCVSGKSGIYHPVSKGAMYCVVCYEYRISFNSTINQKMINFRHPFIDFIIKILLPI